MIKRIHLGTFAIASTLLFACAHNGPYALNGSVRDPSATGEIKVKKESNDNTGLEMRVQHLADPSKLNPEAKTYIVWARPNGQPNAQAQNLGALKIDKDETAKFNTVTPFHDFDLFVTPEKTGDLTQPTSEPVLSARVTNK